MSTPIPTPTPVVPKPVVPKPVVPKQITPQHVAAALREALPDIAYRLPKDVHRALLAAQTRETDERGRLVLEQLTANAALAKRERIPLCQDTGTVWVCLEVGSDVVLAGDVFSLVDTVVAQSFKEGALRKSLVHDALFKRSNTGDNTPAFCEIKTMAVPDHARLQVMLKGGGSDNASRVIMLNPDAGKRGVIEEVLRLVHEKAPNACPPLVIGIGIGATFDKVAGLAKHALMRPIEEVAPDSEVAAFEAELLELVNETGIGPGGLGGETTALAVKIETAPCHIAALPLAVNLGCCAMRRTSIEL